MKRRRLVIWCLAAMCAGLSLNGQSPSPEPADAAARATLARMQGLRKERPNDGILVFYESLVRAGLGERDAAIDLLKTLKGRKLGLIAVRDVGFDSVWNDARFQEIRKQLEAEEAKTPAAPVAFRLKDPKLI